MHTKPYPWRCSKCGEQAVYGAIVDYETTMFHERQEYPIKVDGLQSAKCIKCGQIKLDSAAMEVLDDIFIRQLNILLPEQIREQRLKAKLTTAELANALGIAEGIVAKWEEGGMIQSRSHDNLLRLFFGLPQVREILTTHQIGTLPADVKVSA